MQLATKEVFSNRDYNAICNFLQYCQKIANEKSQTQIASIPMEIKQCDPLAFFQSFYKPHDLSFYFEHPVSNIAIAGVNAVIEASFESPDRFSELRDFSKKVLENTIVMEILDIPFSGPHFFSTFTFNDILLENSAFPPARIFLPYFQVSRSSSQCVLVINVLVAQESDTAFLAKEVWDKYQQLNTIDYPEVSLTQGNKNINFNELGGPNWYKDAVKTAKSYIDKAECEKIVTARALDIESEELFSPLTSLNRLRKSFPLCFSSLVTNGEGQTFISATPERLLKVEKGRLQTEALAGSIARGTFLEEDAHLAKTLLESNKDRLEHQFVVDSIVQRLQSLHITPEFNNNPQLKKLANVQHLYTPIAANIPKDLHILDIAAVLHPTPAVCGTPLEESRKAIAKIENFDRGLYAGVLGWFNHHGDGELVVGIRSALIDGHNARLYAGGGIVKASDPENELKETNIKLQAMLKNLQ
jgi:menaquinone-specific isochorismate synthase